MFLVLATSLHVRSPIGSLARAKARAYRSEKNDIREEKKWKGNNSQLRFDFLHQLLAGLVTRDILEKLVRVCRQFQFR